MFGGIICKIINRIGKNIILKILIWSDILFRLVWKSLINLAIAKAAPIFINSLGCSVIPLNEYHDNAPLILSPNKNNPNRNNKKMIL